MYSWVGDRITATIDRKSVDIQAMMQEKVI